MDASIYSTEGQIRKHKHHSPHPPPFTLPKPEELKDLSLGQNNCLLLAEPCGHLSKLQQWEMLPSLSVPLALMKRVQRVTKENFPHTHTKSLTRSFMIHCAVLQHRSQLWGHSLSLYMQNPGRLILLHKKLKGQCDSSSPAVPVYTRALKKLSNKQDMMQDEFLVPDSEIKDFRKVKRLQRKRLNL